MHAMRSGLMVAFAALALVAGGVAVSAKKIREPAPVPAPEPDAPPEAQLPTVTLRVQEWGVETANWDGTPEAENAGDVPDFYYDASEVPIEGEPDASPQPGPKPVPPDHGGPKKPIIYFDCDQDLSFNLDVKFASGRVTWMYPKPTRRTDAATVQWKDVKLYSPRMERDGTPKLPNLAKVADTHWAGFSRAGSASKLVVNGECEHFIFYEGENTSSPEVDVCKNAEGKFVIRNYSSHPLYTVRLAQQGKLWTAAKVGPASGDTPTEVVLDDAGKAPAPPKDKKEQEELHWRVTRELEAAGMGQGPSDSFANCWRDALLAPAEGTLSYRRDPAALDAMMALTITAKNTTPQITRVGYVLISKIDLSKQGDLDTLAAKAATVDADSLARLKKAGLSGIAAVRRALADKDQALRQRLNLAKVLKELEAARK